MRWSISRNNVLTTCERRYYYQYLLPASLKSKDAYLREIAVLKKLKTIPMWQGEVFHDAIARYLNHIRNGNYSSLPDSWLLWLQKRIQSQWEFSKKKNFRHNPWQTNKESGLALFEHDYDQLIKDDCCDQVMQTVETYVNRFEEWADLSGLKESIRNAQEIWIEPDIFGDIPVGFEVADVQVITKVDLAFLSDNGAFEIYDWKTGHIQKHLEEQVNQAEFQAGVYQLWSHLTLQHPIEKITSHLVYFGGSAVEQQSVAMSQSFKQRILRLVRRNIERELSFLNQSEGAEWTLKDLNYASSMTACQQCPFKRVCERALE